MPADGNPAARIVHYQAGGISCLITRDGEVYRALFNDGLTEHIDPIDGKPRPSPDPATKTKGYKVPESHREPLATHGVFSQRACIFSGTMREAAGSYYGRGIEAPFQMNWFGHVHGIFRKKVSVKGEKELVEKFWVIEVGKEGVFSAPITPGGWGVAAYGSSSWLDLSWAYVNRPDKGVRQLLSAEQIAPAYEQAQSEGDMAGPWAFSYSGHEAQVITRFIPIRDDDDVIDERGTTVPYRRWKLTFSVFGTVWPEVQIEAALQNLEMDKHITPYVHGSQQCFYWHEDGTYFGGPPGKAFWNGYFFGSVNHFPRHDAPSPQDVSVFVYYEGDTERVVKWYYEVFPDGAALSGHYCAGKFNHIQLDTSQVAGDFPEQEAASSLVLFTDREACFAVTRLIYTDFEPKTGEGRACLLIGGDKYEAPNNYHTSSATWARYPEADDFDLGTFVMTWLERSHIGMWYHRSYSNVEATHGNLFYPDTALKPPDQKTNSIYRFTKDGFETKGGFDQPSVQARPVGFVGKA